MSNLSEWIKTCDELEARCNELKDENAHLRAEVDNLRKNADISPSQSPHEIERLKAEVERLKIDAYKKLSMRIEIDKLKARIEYLTNAGDFMADAINGDYNHELPCVKAWNAAKEGKPSA